MFIFKECLPCTQKQNFFYLTYHSLLLLYFVYYSEFSSGQHICVYSVFCTAYISVLSHPSQLNIIVMFMPFTQQMFPSLLHTCITSRMSFTSNNIRFMLAVLTSYYQSTSCMSFTSNNDVRFILALTSFIYICVLSVYKLHVCQMSGSCWQSSPLLLRYINWCYSNYSMNCINNFYIMTVNFVISKKNGIQMQNG